MKIRSRSDIYNWFIVALCFLNAYYCIEPHFSKSILDINFRFIAVFIGVFFVILVLFSSKIRVQVLGVLLLAIGSGIFVFARAPVTSFEYFIKWLEFIASIMLYTTILSNNCQIKDSTWTAIYYSTLLVLVFYVTESLDPAFYIHTSKGSWLILTCGNQNTAAMQLTLIEGVFFLLARRSQQEKRRLRYICCCAAVILILFMIYQTGSRSSLLSVLFISVFFFLPGLEKHIQNYMIGIVVLFPLLFAIFLVMLYRNGLEQIILLGRNIFNGRQIMWDMVFSQPIENWLFGSYHIYMEIGVPPFQLHNGIVDMIASYGIIITAFYLFAIYKLLTHIKSYKTPSATLFVVCILALLVQSTGEAAFFIGGRCSYIAIFLLFTKQAKKEFLQSTIAAQPVFPKLFTEMDNEI